MGVGDSPLQDRLVFLVGARRSGTNWLQRIVCAHSDAVAIPSESHLFSHGLAPLADRFQHGSVQSSKTAKVYLPLDEMHDMLRDVADRVFGGVAAATVPSARLIVERTPWHAFHLDLIGAVYPDAAVLHIVRDGRDIARSLLSQEWGPTTMRAAAHEWRSTVEAARSSGERLARYREIQYEQILGDPEHWIRDLYRWLGLDASSDEVDRALTEAGVRFNTTPLTQRVAADKRSRGLSSADLRTFDAVAGELLDELGYGRERPLAPQRRVTAAFARLSGPYRRSLRHDALGLAAEGLPRLDRPREPRVRSIARMEQIQALLDGVVAAYLAGDAAVLRSLLAPGAFLRWVCGDADRSGRDEMTRDGFLDALAAARSDRVDVIGTEVHPGEPLSAVVVRYRDPSGAEGLETLVVGVGGEHVARMIWYRGTSR